MTEIQGDVVAKRTVAEQVADQLRREIQDGTIPPATRLLQAHIARRYRVSTTPVREALTILQGEGMVMLDPHRGAVVFEPTVDDFRECFEIREALEGLAVARAIPHLTSQDGDQLQDLIDRMSHAATTEEWVQLNNEFHLGIYAAAQLPRLYAMIRTLREASVAYIHMFATVRRESDMQERSLQETEHQMILDACREGNVELAVSAVQTHLWNAVNEIMRGTESTPSMLERLRHSREVSEQGHDAGTRR